MTEWQMTETSPRILNITLPLNTEAKRAGIIYNIIVNEIATLKFKFHVH